MPGIHRYRKIPRYIFSIFTHNTHGFSPCHFTKMILTKQTDGHKPPRGLETGGFCCVTLKFNWISRRVWIHFFFAANNRSQKNELRLCFCTCTFKSNAHETWCVILRRITAHLHFVSVGAKPLFPGHWAPYIACRTTCANVSAASANSSGVT